MLWGEEFDGFCRFRRPQDVRSRLNRVQPDAAAIHLRALGPLCHPCDRRSRRRSNPRPGRVWRPGTVFAKTPLDMMQILTPGRRQPALRGFVPALAFALGVALAGPAQSAQNPQKTWEICAQRTAAAERAAGMPSHLLTAVSKVEAGRWHAQTGEVLAWPWTVTAGGEGRFLPSKAAAIAEVERLRAQGISNIDVGCMQISQQPLLGHRLISLYVYSYVVIDTLNTGFH